MMEIKNFIEKFVEAVEIEDASELEGATKFRDLDDWSSLAALSVISMFEDEFGKDLTVADFRKAQTIEDLFNLAK